jgi:hypothetical protein
MYILCNYQTDSSTATIMTIMTIKTVVLTMNICMHRQSNERIKYSIYMLRSFRMIDKNVMKDDVSNISESRTE